MRPHQTTQQRSAAAPKGEEKSPKEKSQKGNSGQLSRDIDPNYEFDPKNLDPIARCLRSTLMALGHSASAYNCFVKIKSRDVSPDGLLGGQGFVQPVAEMRQLFAACVESLSALSDTLYDELKAPHWSEEAQEESEGVMEDVEELREDPEAWAEEEEEEFDEDDNEDEGEDYSPDDDDSSGSSSNDLLENTE